MPWLVAIDFDDRLWIRRARGAGRSATGNGRGLGARPLTTPPPAKIEIVGHVASGVGFCVFDKRSTAAQIGVVDRGASPCAALMLAGS